jgi:hypothetical protein
MGKQPMSREALTALACSVVHRVDGLPEVYIKIAPIERDAAGRNWDVILPAGFSPNNLADRVQEALAPWRDRFDVVT